MKCAAGAAIIIALLAMSAAAASALGSAPADLGAKLGPPVRRGTPTPGAPAALRRLLESIASGAPDYSMLTPEFSADLRVRTQAREQQATLGQPLSVRFREFDGYNDVFDVHFARSTWRYTITLAADGKVAGSSIVGPVTRPDRSLIPYASIKNSVRLPDGRTIHMVCMGKGRPLVILTPGGNDYSFVWNKVQPVVAKTTRVCAWERAGAGLSSPTAEAQTVAQSATDLQEALKVGKLGGPYLLVGYARGAGESLVLKDREPSKVVGMVLVDPAPPGFRAERDRVEPSLSLWESEHPDPAVAFLLRCAAAIRAGTAQRRAPGVDRCLHPPIYPSSYPLELSRALERHFTKLSFGEIAASMDSAAAQLDTGEFARRDSAASANDRRDYGNMPLVVLTLASEASRPSGPKPPLAVLQDFSQSNAELHRAQQALAKLTRRGVERTIPGSPPMIPQNQPNAVIEAIEDVIHETRAP